METIREILSQHLQPRFGHHQHHFGNQIGIIPATIQRRQASATCTVHGGVPFIKRLKNMVCTRMITNFHVTLDYIKNANTIFGPSLPSLKVKMMRRKPKPVFSNYIKILKDILQLQKIFSVVADIMFFNGMSFLVSISRHVKFTIVQYLRKRKTGNISKYLGNINDVYYRHGMYVETF